MREFYRTLASVLLLAVFSLSVSSFPAQSGEARRNQIISWKKPSISVAVSSSLTKATFNIRDGSDVAGAVRRSLEAWEKVANIKFDETLTDKQNVSPSGNSGDGVNLITIAPNPENLLMFSKDTQETAARTRVFFNRKGAITEADIVLNPYQQFSTDGSIGTYDLESILTHEIGHLLGLDHSTILGATMHESGGKNGVYNLPALNLRTLAETDIAAVRALYGGKTETDNCCGLISGKLIADNARVVKNYHIWAEEAETGRVSAEGFADTDGVFELSGLTAGKYRVFAQNLTANKFAAAESLGSVEVAAGKAANIVQKLSQTPINFQVQYIGFNGQLAESSVALNAGKTYKIYLGGKNLHSEDFDLSFDSPFITVVPRTTAKIDFSRDVTALSFEVSIAVGAPNGEYSLSIGSKNGQKSVIAGAISVENFNNPWSVLSVNGD